MYVSLPINIMDGSFLSNKVYHNAKGKGDSVLVVDLIILVEAFRCLYICNKTEHFSYIKVIGD